VTVDPSKDLRRPLGDRHHGNAGLASACPASSQANSASRREVSDRLIHGIGPVVAPKALLGQCKGCLKCFDSGSETDRVNPPRINTA
jgi:hypothetical protein